MKNSDLLVVLIVVQIVHSKTATALALTSVKNEDKHEFSKIVEAVKVPVLSLFKYVSVELVHI